MENIQKCLAETRQHIARVGHYINKFTRDLIHRAEIHDESKLHEPELSGFAANTGKLEKVEFGTPEYQALLDELKPFISHHHNNNEHHPEFHKHGVNDMTLVDLVEMISDWAASSERMKNGNIRKSIEINAARFDMCPQLVRIFENTAKKYLNG